MNPAKVQRDKLKQLTDLPNVGKTIAADLRCIGIDNPQQLVGRDAFEMYRALCEVTAQYHDPCMLDVFMSITAFMDGDDPQPWWYFTEQRKQRLRTQRDD